MRVAIVGRLSGMSRREAHELIRRHGGMALERARSANLLVVGDEQVSLVNALLGAPLEASAGRGDLIGEFSVNEQVPERPDDQLDDDARRAAERGELEIISETELWRRLGLVDIEQNIQRLHTPAMLAELLGVTVAVVRRWHRRGLIKPAREVRKLAYFDFREVLAARRLAELLASGMPPAIIEKRLAEWKRYLPEVERPLAQLSVIARGKHLLLRQGEGLVAPGGQLWFNFAGEEAGLGGARPAHAAENELAAGETILPLRPLRKPLNFDTSPEELLALAEELEEEGELAAAGDAYRAVLASRGPDADTSFALAEVLYRLGDMTAARERYFMAIELNEDFVEARANLGCLLAELGQLEMAVAAFEGALRYHPDYADVHYHLARTLCELGRSDEAEEHWRTFLQLAPDSPWAAEARRLMGLEEE